MRVLFAAFVIFAAVGSAADGFAQCENNVCTTIVLTAESFFGGCGGTAVDCVTNMPLVDVTGIAAPAIYVILANYNEVTGLQAAFEWPATWTLSFGLWACQTNQVFGTQPSGTGGETDGTIATAFDAISGGTAEVIGAINFATAPDGCLTIIDSSFPDATHVVNPAFEPQTAPVIEENRGSICVGTGGYDACEPVIAVEPTTWGQIKGHYR